MLRTKHLKMAVVPMTLLALLSTAVPVASAQETTDESFYELTTTPSGGDMIVGEPGTTILFDSSNGELVDVLPPSEAEDYSVTVSRGCADSNAGCWAGGNASGWDVTTTFASIRMTTPSTRRPSAGSWT